MTTEAWVIVLGVVPVFFAGWFARGLYDSLKEHRMETPTTRPRLRPFERLFDWFSHGNRLVGLVVLTALLSGSALGYTFTADQQSEGRSEDLVSCISHYVRVTSEAQAPRTRASVVANDARRDWDAGHSEQEPSLSKDELKDRYLRLYDDYVAVRAGNPLPEFNFGFCQAER